MQKSQSSKVTNIKPKQQQQPIPIPDKSENVRVAVRIRPMNETQLSRNDQQCLEVQSQSILQISHKGVIKSYQFNCVLDQSYSQSKCYQKCNVDQLIDSAIDGYSATVFAYGQTGSGKTYTMAGKQQLFTREVYKSDQKQGIIPRAIQSLWKKIKNNHTTCSIKASYSQIYNQQIKDLLNLSSGVLHCRWNPANGFFVQDLIVVDCSNIDDMISVLNEGMRNRKSGSHEMNKDSSRSHSILTLYIVSQVKTTGTKTTKKYGKISFVDLAGSERLKESKSQGDMIKETGNINKSLFTLGKVIKGLTDKKTKTPYIPYRDSKLTMLLMDSLGGNSKALMIACTTPSSLYFQETLSTLNYAARTMNIKNKPVIQMDQKDQIIAEIQSQIDALRKQNVYLREQYQRISKGLPLKIPQLDKNIMTKTTKIDVSHSTQLPPLEKGAFTGKADLSASYQIKKTSKNQNVINQYQLKFEQMKKQNELMRKQKQQSEQMYRKLMEMNSSIQNKLDNLQQIFLNKKKDNATKDQIVTSSLLSQNTQLKKKLREIEQQKMQLTWQTSLRNLQDKNFIHQENILIQQEIQKLQSREKQLLEELQKKK